MNNQYLVGFICCLYQHQYQVWQLVRMKNKPCWNSKAMGMHLAHTISIIKNKLKKFFLRPDLALSNLLFFFNVFSGKQAWHPPDYATPFSVWLQIAKIPSFLLMYRLFLYQQLFCQNIEKGLRFFFKMTQFSQSPQSNFIPKKYFLQLFSIF